MKLTRRQALCSLATASALPFLRFGKVSAQSLKTKRVVIASLGGGLRRREALGMAEGATLPNLFGRVPLISGFGAEAKPDPQIAPEYVAAARPLVLPPARQKPLYTQGTLIANLRYAAGAPGHLQGQACLVSGFYNNLENRGDARLPVPTLFELVRRARSSPATDAWYLSTLAGFYHALQASEHPEYGARFGASYLSPPAVMSPIFPILTSGQRHLDLGQGALNLPSVPKRDAELAAAAKLRAILDGNFPTFPDDPTRFRASEGEVESVRAHLAELFSDPSYQSLFPDTFGIGVAKETGELDQTPDALTVYHAERILDAYKPSIMAVTLLDIDAAHDDYNGYLRGQQVADALISHLWSFIESHPELKGETALLVLPEHGRHLYDNGKNADSLGRSGVDHGDGDDGDRDVFALALGPDFKPGAVIEPTGIRQPGRSSGSYETIDVIATAATLLGQGEAMKSALEGADARPGLLIEELLR